MWRLRHMLGDIAGLSGRRAPTVKLPRAPLYPLACAAEAVARVTGKEPFLTVDALNMSRYRMFFSSAKAERELGYAARPYKEGLKDALAWFARQRVSANDRGHPVRLSCRWRSGFICCFCIAASGCCASATARPSPSLNVWPSVVAVVPARNEADVIQHSIGSLLAQDYPGALPRRAGRRSSDDGTAELARAPLATTA